MKNNKRILDAARDFRIASEMLRSKFGEPIFPLRSTVVTIAFSIELYLKYLAASVGLEIKGHDLNVLYMKLPEDMRTRIASQFCGSRPIVDILQDYRNIFVDWRYIYEKQDSSFSINDIPSLLSLRDTLEQLASELANCA